MKLSENSKCVFICVAFWMLAFAFILWCCRADGAEVRLSWNLNDPREKVTKYRIWRGIELLAEAEKPPATIVLDGNPAVLTITAIGEGGESGHSDPLTIIPVTIQESTDLNTWRDTKTVYLEKMEKAFYRLKIVVSQP